MGNWQEEMRNVESKKSVAEFEEGNVLTQQSKYKEKLIRNRVI